MPEVVINHFKIDRNQFLPSLKGLNTINCGCKPQSGIRTPFINPEGVELKIPKITVDLTPNEKSPLVTGFFHGMTAYIFSKRERPFRSHIVPQTLDISDQLCKHIHLPVQADHCFRTCQAMDFPHRHGKLHLPND